MLRQKKNLSYILDEYFSGLCTFGCAFRIFFKSGGVDSPLVNAILKKLGHKMNAFTISTDYLGVNEADNAKKDKAPILG